MTILRMLSQMEARTAQDTVQDIIHAHTEDMVDTEDMDNVEEANHADGNTITVTVDVAMIMISMFAMTFMYMM
jgi:hypothetical protein